MQEIRVQSFGWEDPLEEKMATHSHGQRSLAGYSPWGPKELDTTEGLTLHSHLTFRDKVNKTQCQEAVCPGSHT